MGQPTILCEARGSLVVYVGGDATPTSGEWDAYLALLRRVGGEHGRVRIAVFAQSGAPTAMQRKQAAALGVTVPHRSAVIAHSVVARAVVTGLHWLGVDIRAFGPQATGEAFDFLEASPQERAWLTASERELAPRLAKAGSRRA